MKQRAFLESHIKTFRSSLDPFQVYKNLSRGAALSFFLDSPRYQEPDQRYSILGANPDLEIRLGRQTGTISGSLRSTFKSQDFLRVLRSLLAQNKIASSKRPFFLGGWVGCWNYEWVEHLEKIRFRAKPGPQGPLVHLGFYRDVLVYDHRKHCYYACVLSRANESRASIRKRCSILESALDPDRKLSEALPAFQLHAFRPETTAREFEAMVDRAREYIRAGDIYQANLSQRFLFDYEGDPLAIYGRLRAINPSPFSCFLKFRGTCMVSSSPERLIRKQGNLCETRPIAGTRPIRKGLPAARVVRNLLKDSKERAEHIMLVDLERNDLGRVCDFRTVKVEEMMTTERYSHVVHIVSKISGRIRKDKDALDLIAAMFPGGTITGCPKIRCMEIIDELEKSRRGLYTGSIGYLDLSGNLDLNIVIRTLVLSRGKGVLQAGAGIVYDSNPRKEYEETLHKAEALVEALAMASKD